MAKQILQVARVALLVCLVAVSANAAAEQAPAVPGVRVIEVDGYDVRVQVIGLEHRRAGSPVIVFEAGFANSLDVWGKVLPQVSSGGPVVAYDRAGLGQSEWDNQPPTPQHVSDRLRRLLKALGAEPPYLLVGYSWGGVLSRYFAGRYPREVAGLVLVDPGPIVTEPLSERLAPYEAVGSGKAGYDAFWSAFGAVFAKAPPAVRAEFDVFRGLMDRDVGARNVPEIPDVPLVVLVAGKYLPLPGIQVPYDPRAHFDADLRHRLRLLYDWSSSRSILVLANNTTHAIPREDPELIVWAITRVLSAIQAKPAAAGPVW